MFDGMKLQQGERIIVQSKRGGPAGYNGCVWLGILFGASQLFGAMMMVPIFLGSDSDGPGPEALVMPALTILVGGAVLTRWMLMKMRPAYIITDRRLIARRVVLPPVAIELDNVAVAARVLVQYYRYGRVVSEVLTHRVGVAFRSGGSRRFGPIKDADEFVSILQGVAQGFVDCRALPGVEGELAPAEKRPDLFYARTTLTGGMPRGPVFVGPTKVIGFAEPFLSMKQYQMMTIVGANRSPEEIEQSMLALAQNSEFGRGRAVIMDREGVNLVVEGKQLKLVSGGHMVAFDLTPEDAERAAKYTKAGQAHAYR